MSRLLVAFILGLLLLVIDAAFTISAASIRDKITQMGVRTLFLTRVVNPTEAEADPSYLSRLVQPLRNDGGLLRLMQIGRFAHDEMGTRRLIYVYERSMLDALPTNMSNDGSSGVFLISDQFPAGMRTTVTLDEELEVVATAIPPPIWFRKFGANPSAILLPQETFPSFTDAGFFEMVVFLGSELADLARIESDLRILFSAEGINNVQINSPREFLDQLDELQRSQSQWRTGFGLFGGLAVALVFGSISILEYRENRFVSALLKSFGAPPVLLITRYLAESVLLVLLAAATARQAAIHLHHQIFGKIGIDSQFLDRNVVDPYLWSSMGWQLGGLGAGALLSAIPVAFAMRSPVGKILT